MRKTKRPSLSRRRQLLGAAGAMAGFGLVGRAATAAPPAHRGGGGGGPGQSQPIQAYASATSVKPGEVLRFHASFPGARAGSSSSFPFAIVRVGQPDQWLLNATVVLRREPVPASASTGGCNWPVCYSLTIPPGMPSGLYYAAFGSDSTYSMVPFVVRPVAPTPGVALLVQVPVTTAQAYNNFGGKSLYDYNSTAGVRASQVSFDRPLSDPYAFAFDRWQAPWVRWLAANGVAADFCTSIDLHRESGLLTPYRLLALAGHDEYWSRTMRERVDAFVAAGGNLAVFSGNTAWWQVRMQASAAGTPARNMVCFKSAALDPTPDPALETVLWDELVPPQPINASIGLSTRTGAIWPDPAGRPATPFVVQDAAHWVFAGAGLTTGSGFAGAYAGYEMDSAPFQRGIDGLAYTTGAASVPRGMRLLAMADATGWQAAAQSGGYSSAVSGWGAIAVFSRGGSAGTVFNAGSTDWVLALAAGATDGQAQRIARITANVLQRLSRPHTEPAPVRRWREAQVGGGYRFEHGTAAQVGAGAWVLDGAAFSAYLQPQAGTVPVYRYSRIVGSVTIVMLSVQSAIDPATGWLRDDIAFHAFAAAGSATVPVYQHRQALAGSAPALLYDTRSVPPAGFVSDGLVFHAPGIA
jgi:hypothetical protein